VGSPVSRRIARVRRYSSALAARAGPPRPGCHGLWRRFPDVFGFPVSAQCGAAAPPQTAYNPADARPAGLTRPRFGLAPVRSPLLRGCYLFLGVLRCFNSPGALRTTRCGSRAMRLGCPIRRSWDRCPLAAPPRLSQLCHVLHRHAAPRHPPSAHRVFPAGTLGVGSLR
jgi:hypothetical protein